MSEPTSWRIGPILGVRDVKKAVDYYTSVLGFECPGGIFEGVAPGEGGVYAIVRRGEVEIHLPPRPSLSSRSEPRRQIRYSLA